MTQAQIRLLSTQELWGIVGSRRPIGNSADACNELTWAKAELRNRGFVLA